MLPIPSTVIPTTSPVFSAGGSLRTVPTPKLSQAATAARAGAQHIAGP
ncbi:hypothetical protein [Pseudarthrobacter sp. TAF60_1]